MQLCSYLAALWLAAGGAGLANAQAQASIQAAGGEASGPGGTIIYTVGQVDYLSASGPGGSLSSGVQQPFELFVLSAARAVRIALEVYPNPTTNSLMLQVDEKNWRDLRWHLTDLSGRLLQTQALADPQTAISLADYPAGAYLLRVQRREQALKTFKIIKH